MTQASQDVDLEQLKKQHKKACERAKKLATKMGGADVTCLMWCSNFVFSFQRSVKHIYLQWHIAALHCRTRSQQTLILTSFC